MLECRKSKGIYKFYNHNPQKKVTNSDCVMRSIGKAANKSWVDVYLRLCEIGLESFNVPNVKSVYEKYLDELGFRKFKRPKKNNGKFYTVKEFCKLYAVGTYVVSTSGHLTCVIDGYIYDTWNTSSCSIGNYWKLEKEVDK